MKNRKADSNNLAIIGDTGAGKTTLAVGLCATSTKTFDVSPVGDATSKYLEIRKTSIEEGFWPEASLESVNLDLRLSLNASGNQTEIVFREYMGERMERDPNYIREVIGTPKSAMILFNPGMPALATPEKRNRMLGHLKKIVQHLKDNKCIAVAFVVTASDRLASDLAASREDFEAYASEVTNHLTNLGLNWKRFDVTVSGKLDEQNKPKLARGENNTTHEPFLWLLKRISDSKHRKWLLTAAAVFATILGVSSAVFGGLVVHDRQVLTRAETDFANTTNELNMAYAAHDEAKVRTTSQFIETNRFDKIRTILPSDRARKVELVNRANEQSDLWRVRLLNMELASNKSRIATKPLDVRLDWFDDFNKLLAASLPVFRDAVVERNTLTNEWAKSRGMLETMCQTAHFCYEVDQERKNLTSAKPDALSASLQKSKELIADAVTYALVTNRADLRSSLELMKARTNAIVRYVDSKMRKPEDDNPPEGSTIALRQQISKELKRGLTNEEFDNLTVVISQRCDAARKAWEEYHFPLRVEAQIDGLRAVSDAPANELRSSRGFLEGLDKQFPSIPEYKRSAAKEKITNERTAAIGRYLKAKAPWKPEDEERPVDTSVLQNQVRQELQSALSDAEFESLWAQLENRCDEACRAWDAYHFPRRVTELGTALKGAGSNPSRSLTDSLAFLSAMTNNYPTIPQVEFIKARNAIEAARNNALIAYANSIACKWNVNGSRPPEYDAGGIRTAILTEVAVTDEEYKSFSSGMNARFEKARQEWATKQKTLVDEFVIDGDIEAVIRNYGGFCDDWPNNPYLDKLNRKIESQLIGFFRGYISEYCSEFFGKDRVGNAEYPKSRMEKAQMRFNKFKGVCLAITGRGLSSTPIPKTNVGRFAADCVNYGNLQDAGIAAAFGQEFKITEVAVKFSPSSLDSSFERLVIGCNLLAERWNFSLGCKEKLDDISLFTKSLYKSACDGGWYRLWSGNVTIRANPWTFTSFRISYGDKTGFLMVDKSGSTGWWLNFEEGRNSPEYSTNIRLVHDFNTDTAGELSIRITFSGKGTDLINLWKRSMQ